MKIIVMILCSALLLTQLGGFPPITPENAAQLREVRRIGNGTIQEVAWSPDGQTLAVGGTTGVWLYTAGDLQQAPRLLDGHTERILTLAFSPDGSRLATGSADRNTIVWDLATGSILATLSGQSSQGEAGGGTDWVRAVAFHPDGQRIAVARIYGMVELWNPQTGEITPGPQFFCGARVAYAMVFSADGTRLFSACNAILPPSGCVPGSVAPFRRLRRDGARDSRRQVSMKQMPRNLFHDTWAEFSIMARTAVKSEGRRGWGETEARRVFQIHRSVSTK